MSIIVREVGERPDICKIFDAEGVLVTAMLAEIYSEPKKVVSPDFHGMIGDPNYVINKLINSKE